MEKLIIIICVSCLLAIVYVWVYGDISRDIDNNNSSNSNSNNNSSNNNGGDDDFFSDE